VASVRLPFLVPFQRCSGLSKSTVLSDVNTQLPGCIRLRLLGQSWRCPLLFYQAGCAMSTQAEQFFFVGIAAVCVSLALYIDTFEGLASIVIIFIYIKHRNIYIYSRYWPLSVSVYQCQCTSVSGQYRV